MERGDDKLMYETKILLNATKLFEKDGWILLDAERSDSYIHSKYKSELWHKCIEHKKLTTAFMCISDDSTNNLWRCTNCIAIVPPEFVGLWKLHNFDKQSDLDE